jgi:hypothetical protein
MMDVERDTAITIFTAIGTLIIVSTEDFLSNLMPIIWVLIAIK